jgi:hypothetical protein
MPRSGCTLVCAQWTGCSIEPCLGRLLANRSQRERLAPDIPRHNLLNEQPQNIETARNMGTHMAIFITSTTGETYRLCVANPVPEPPGRYPLDNAFEVAKHRRNSSLPVGDTHRSLTSIEVDSPNGSFDE